ncbi:MAG: outer membrane beta-barrel protein [Planctomycetales bacterium]
MPSSIQRHAWKYAASLGICLGAFTSTSLIWGQEQPQAATVAASDSASAPYENYPYSSYPLTNAIPTDVPYGVAPTGLFRSPFDQDNPEPPAEPATEEPAEEDSGWQLTSLLGPRWGCNGFKVGGSMVNSYVYNFNSPSNHFNGPVTWTDRSNEYQLNQQWLYFERATSTEEKNFDIGGRIDMLYGTNYRWATSAGLEDRWSMNTSQSFYGMALPNAYLEVASGDVKLKLGHFVSPVGFFTVDTTQNFFYTIPYTYQYGEPFTHWGGLLTWNATDNLVIGGGVTRGWDNFDGSGSGSPNAGALGTVTYTFEDKSSVAMVFVWSNEYNNRTDAAGNLDFSSRYFQTFVYTKPINDQWTYVLQSDFGTQGSTSDFSGTRDIGTARWYGVNQYLFYKQCDSLSWGANFEWFRDESGYRVGCVLPTLSNPGGSDTRGLPASFYGYAGNFFQASFGPKWTPTKNLMIRPNVRWDCFAGESLNTGGLRPFDNGLKNYQGIMGLDVSFLY